MHPYAQALIDSLPNLENKGVFKGIPGLAPSLLRLPPRLRLPPALPVRHGHVQERRAAAEQSPAGCVVPPATSTTAIAFVQPCASATATADEALDHGYHLLEFRNVSKIVRAAACSSRTATTALDDVSLHARRQTSRPS